MGNAQDTIFFGASDPGRGDQPPPVRSAAEEHALVAGVKAGASAEAWAAENPALVEFIAVRK